MYNQTICNKHHNIKAQLDHFFSVLFLKFCYITDVLEVDITKTQE